MAKFFDLIPLPDDLRLVVAASFFYFDSLRYDFRVQLFQLCSYFG